LLYGLDFKEKNTANTAKKILENKKQPLQKGSKIVIFGTPVKSRAILKTQLATVEIELKTKIDKTTTHILVGKKINEKQIKAIVDSGLPIVFSQDIELFMESQAAFFLVPQEKSEDTTAQVANIKALIRHYDEANIGLALEIMEGGGVPAALITELLIIIKASYFSAKLRQKAKKLFELKASPTLQLRLKKHYVICNDFKAKGWLHYMKETELDWRVILDFVLSRTRDKQLTEPMFAVIPAQETGHYLRFLAAIPNRQLTLDDFPRVAKNMAIKLKIFTDIRIVTNVNLFNRLGAQPQLENLDLLSFDYLTEKILAPLALLPKLKTLTLSHSVLYKFPQIFYDLTSLKKIDLSRIYNIYFKIEDVDFSHFDQARYEKEQILYRLEKV
jgi:hypothetical protein